MTADSQERDVQRQTAFASTGTGSTEKVAKKLLEEFREDRERQEEHRGRMWEMTAEVARLNNQVKELRQENSKLRAKKKSLESSLEKFQKSVPIPVYVMILVGVIISIYGTIIATDLIYFIGGVSIIAVGISAIIESKVRKNRIS